MCQRVHIDDRPRTFEIMTTTLSVRIDVQTRQRLAALAKRSRRSESLLAAEAIAAYVETESWQVGEIAAGLDDIEQGRTVEHDEVAGWLRSWGGPHERQAPDH